MKCTLRVHFFLPHLYQKSHMPKIKDIFGIVNELAPSEYAEEWDSVGLQVGDPESEVTGIMVALDSSLEALKEMSDKDMNLLITHHPLLFSSIKSIDSNFPLGNIIKSAILRGITIFSAHTNLDSTGGGINDTLAAMLGIISLSPIEPVDNDANSHAGSGRIGRLSQETALEDLVPMIKEKLGAPYLRVCGDMKRVISGVALCGGSGGSLIGKATELGADLFISGDISYHQARQAEDIGICIIDAGHFSSEKAAIGGIVELIKIKLAERGIDIQVEEFKGEKEPFAVI